MAETLRRLRVSRELVNRLIDELSRDLHSVDCHNAPLADLSWLADQDDRAVVQSALAAGATMLVTENSKDFPLGERRNGVLFLQNQAFLTWLYETYPSAEADVREYLARQEGLPPASR